MRPNLGIDEVNVSAGELGAAEADHAAGDSAPSKLAVPPVNLAPIANAADIGADPTQAALVGDSIGGNMTTALTLTAKKRGGPQMTNRSSPRSALP